MANRVTTQSTDKEIKDAIRMLRAELLRRQKVRAAAKYQRIPTDAQVRRSFVKDQFAKLDQWVARRDQMEAEKAVQS